MFGFASPISCTSPLPLIKLTEMRKAIATLFFMFVSLLSYAQVREGNAENLQPLLQDVLIKAKQYSVYSSRVDWTALEAEVLQRNNTILSTDDFVRKMKLIFQAMGDTHGAFYFNGRRIRYGNNSEFKVRPSLLKAFEAGKPEVKAVILESGYGYISVPGTSNYDQRTCQQLQDSLCSLELKDLKGIVIDLRLNEGGSVYPGFSGLNQLFGSELVAYSANLDGSPQSAWSVRKGAFLQGGRQAVVVKNGCKPNKDLKIAILLSQITASSGEMLAVAFKGREKTIFIGEKTAGFTTINSEFRIGKHYLGIASGFITDRKGRVYFDHVEPDVEIIEGDNFTDLREDSKVQAALQWLKEE